MPAINQASNTNAILHFAAGIPGLSAEWQNFDLFKPSQESLFYFLQSKSEDDIVFVLINPFDVFPDYVFELPDEEAKRIGLEDPAHIAVFTIVNAKNGIAGATVNLLAPIVVNSLNNEARQVVLEDKKYSVRQPLFPKPENKLPPGKEG